MNIEFSCDYFATGKDAHGRLSIQAENFQLSQTTNATHLLLQMDQKDVVSFLRDQGFLVETPAEISWEEFKGDFV